MSGIGSSTSKGGKGTERARDAYGRFIKKDALEALDALESELGVASETDVKDHVAILTIKEEMEKAESDLNLFEERVKDLERQLELSTWVSNSEALNRAKERKAVEEQKEALKKEIEEISLTKESGIMGDGADLDIKAPPPEEFDGSPEKLRSFLTQCELVFAMKAKKFESGRARILYALSYCNKGTALPWKEKIIQDQETFIKMMSGSAQEKGLSLWQTTRLMFQEIFSNATAKAEAQNKLLTIRQGNEKVEEYTVRFTLLGFDSELREDALVIFYKRGLKAPIKQRIYETGNIPVTLKDWQDRAKAIDIGWRESQLERISQPKTFGKARVTQTTTFNNRPRLSDEEFQKRRNEKACFKCGLKGHFAKECRVKGRRAQVYETEELNEEKPAEEQQGFI